MNQLKVLQLGMSLMQHKFYCSIVWIQQADPTVHTGPIIPTGIFIQCPRHILRHLLLGIASVS